MRISKYSLTKRKKDKRNIVCCTLTSSAQSRSHVLDQFIPPAPQLLHDPHGRLGLAREPRDGLPLDQGLVRRLIHNVRKDGGAVAHGRDDAAVGPDLLGDALQAAGRRVVDEGGVAGRGVEDAVAGAVEVGRLGHVVQLLPELAARVLPGRQVGAAEEVGLLREPVGRVAPRLGRQVHLEPRRPEHLEGVQGFADEEAGCFFAFEEGGVGRCHGDEGAAR